MKYQSEKLIHPENISPDCLLPYWMIGHINLLLINSNLRWRLYYCCVWWKRCCVLISAGFSTLMSPHLCGYCLLFCIFVLSIMERQQLIYPEKTIKCILFQILCHVSVGKKKKKNPRYFFVSFSSRSVFDVSFDHSLQATGNTSKGFQVFNKPFQ